MTYKVFNGNWKEVLSSPNLGEVLAFVVKMIAEGEELRIEIDKEAEHE